MRSPHVKPLKPAFNKSAAEEPSTPLEARAAAFVGLTPRKVEAAIQGGMVDVTAAMFGTDAALVWRLSHRWLE